MTTFRPTVPTLERAQAEIAILRRALKALQERVVKLEKRPAQVVEYRPRGLGP